MSVKAFVRIKSGTLISQDHAVFRWPECKPPRSEYLGEVYQYRAKNPDMIFEAIWDGKYWNCTRSGYGRLELYGNGTILVVDQAGVEVDNTVSFKDTVAQKPVRVHKAITPIIKLLPAGDRGQCVICNDRCGSDEIKVLLLRDMYIAMCESCRTLLKKVLND